MYKYTNTVCSVRLACGWLKTLMANASKALASSRGSNREKRQQEKIDALQEKVRKKDGVIAEVTEEFVRLKKELGEL